MYRGPLAGFCSPRTFRRTSLGLPRVTGLAAAKMASPALSPLDAGDGYAKELDEWRSGRLATWERTFESWDGSSELRPPPAPPTTSRWVSKTKGVIGTPRLCQPRLARLGTRGEYAESHTRVTYRLSIISTRLRGLSPRPGWPAAPPRGPPCPPAGSTNCAPPAPRAHLLT